MNSNTLLISGFLIWGTGYMLNMLLQILPKMELVGLPNWIIPLFGKPIAKSAPSGVVYYYHLKWELSGILMVIWGVAIKIFSIEPMLFTLVGFIFSLTVGHLLSKWLFMKTPYKM